MKTQKLSKVHKQRHGLHHKRNHKYLKTYFPYLPVVIAILVSLGLSSWQPTPKGTLAYATEISTNNLLQATNHERVINSQSVLSLNQRLNNAAQAKANDMIERNYWSHNTPDGQEPWVFISNAGYDYQKAGENLAYGFATSTETVTGWMNSPSHRQNMLDSNYVEVGFGFANSSNYNSSGPETVVVAMYGKPQTLASIAPPTPSPAPQAAAPIPETTAQPANNQVSESTIPTPVQSQENDKATVATTPVNTDFPVIEENGGLQPITRVDTLTKGRAPWALFGIGITSGLAIMLLLIKHSLAFRHVISKSEHLILNRLHHPLFDSIVLGIVIISVTLSHTVGFIR